MILERKVLDMQSNNLPYLAVYMITYNHGEFIEQSIESIMNQKTNFHYKLIIGEDLSSDDTRAICKRLKDKYPDKIDLFLNETNLGANLNAKQIFTACFESGAKYMALCEGDDNWTDPLKLQKQVDFLENNEDYVLCFHAVQILKQDREIVDDFITNIPENYETIQTFAEFGNYIHTPSVVFRNVIKKFPFEMENSPIGDYFLFLMLAQYGKLKFIDSKMAVYRYGVGIFSNTSEISITKNNLKLFACLLSYFEDEEIKKIILKRYFIILSYFEESIHNSYSNRFVSNHLFFKFLKTFKDDYKSPRKMMQKIINKLKRK